MKNRFQSDSAIPSVTETLRMQRQEQQEKARRAEQAAEQNRKR